jgi:DNA-binding PadR family transcriptional regulator
MVKLEYPRRREALSSAARLLVLGLLEERPMHGYEILQLIGEGELDRWTPVQAGSIYYALNKLEQDGLIRTAAEQRTGDRLRRVYATTEAGGRELRRLLLGALAKPPHSTRSELALAAAWLHLLPREEVLERLAAAREAVRAGRAEVARGRAAKAGLSPIAEALFDNAEAILDADERLLDRVRDLLADGPPAATRLDSTPDSPE